MILLYNNYTQAAIDGADSGPKPDRSTQEKALVDALVAEIHDPNGDLDLEELIDLNV